MGNNTDGDLSLHKGFRDAGNGNYLETLEKGFSYYLNIFKKILTVGSKNSNKAVWGL